MAEQPEQATPEAEGEANKGGKAGLLVLIVVAVAATGGGFVTPYVITAMTAEPAPVETEQKPKVDLPPPVGESMYIPFDETVVNLDEGRLNRYLRLKVNLQVDKAQADGITKMMEQKKPILKNWLLSYLSDKGMDDIRGRVGQNRLRREIQDHFNTVLFVDGYDRIHDVLFDEFNVQ